MVEIIFGEKEVFKIDREAGLTWYLGEDENENPEWVEILHRKRKET